MRPHLDYELFGLAAAIVSAVAFVPYVLSIFRGETRPAGASWWTWSLLTATTVLSSWSAGAPWEVLVLPSWLCFSQLSVAFFSIKRGDHNWDLLNKICVAAACAGLVLWLLSGQALLALVISITADVFASVPNLRHAWKSPQEENRLGWSLGFGSAVLVVLAISEWSVAEAGWAIYFLCSMTLTVVCVWRPVLKNLVSRVF